MVSIRHLARRMARRLRRGAGDTSAVAAVEFALVLPLMLALYFGANEFGDGLTINRKVTHLTSTLADLTAQAKSVSNADMTNILNVGSAILEPYNSDNLRARVSLIHIDGNGVARVKWSDVSNYGSSGGTYKPLMSAIPVNTVVTIPAAVATNNTYVVSAEVHYYYTPTIGYMLTGVFDLTDTFYLSPRLSSDVKRPPAYTG